MRMSRLRKTGKPVPEVAIEGLWRKLYTLWENDPLGFVDFVQHSRKRSVPIDSRTTLLNLLGLGLIDGGDKFPVHDAIRELIAMCVEGEGITTMLHRPFQGDEAAVSVLSVLHSGKMATHAIAAKAQACLGQLLEQDYVAFAELVRLVRDGKEPNKTFGSTLKSLINFGAVHLRNEGGEMERAIHALFQTVLGGRVLIDGPMKLVPDEVISAILLESAVGTRGLDFGLRSPFKAATEHTTPHASNEHAGNGQGNGSSHHQRRRDTVMS